MALDRWIALIILTICLVYGYTAFFTMDGVLPPFMQRNPVWPSTFPKILAVTGVVLSLCIVVGLEKDSGNAGSSEIDYRRLFKYKFGQATVLLVLMIIYALLLRPAGFLLSTVAFLVAGPVILGERRLVVVVVAAVIAAGTVWYLVQEVLGIFLRPWPFFLAG